MNISTEFEQVPVAALWPPRRSIARGSLAAVLLLMAIGCDRRVPDIAARSDDDRVQESALDRTEAEPVRGETNEDLVGHLERLRRRGHFEEFIDGALNAADDDLDNAPLEVLKTEALLASGRAEDAAATAMAAAEAAGVDSDWSTSGHALKLWAMARFRAQKSLDEPNFLEALDELPEDEPAATMLRFWHDALAARSPYRLDSLPTAEPVEVATARTSPGGISSELVAVEARINGNAAPLAFVDTGTQYALMTVRAAQAAGVSMGPATTRLVGFAGLQARPGLIETLELGTLVLHDVPVLVGDSPPLVALGGQISLGTELMHHVRFTIDYPARRVMAGPAHARPFDPRRRRPTWAIPLWTFSQAALTRGQLAGGALARVLVDTGDRTGTFVSPRWARRNLPGYPRASGPVVFKYKKNLSLDQLELGNLTLRDWAIVDTMPTNFERLDMVDLLVGRELLAPYELTIDMPARVLELRSASRESTEGNAP